MNLFLPHAYEDSMRQGEISKTRTVQDMIVVTTDIHHVRYSIKRRVAMVVGC